MISRIAHVLKYSTYYAEFDLKKRTVCIKHNVQALESKHYKIIFLRTLPLFDMYVCVYLILKIVFTAICSTYFELAISLLHEIDWILYKTY